MTSNHPPDENAPTSTLRVLNVVRWIFLAIAAGGVLLIVLWLGEPGSNGLSTGIGTVLFALACFVVSTIYVRKGRKKGRGI